jgi:hypothetical protein
MNAKSAIPKIQAKTSITGLFSFASHAATKMPTNTRIMPIIGSVRYISFLLLFLVLIYFFVVLSTLHGQSRVLTTIELGRVDQGVDAANSRHIELSGQGLAGHSG